MVGEQCVDPRGLPAGSLQHQIDVGPQAEPGQQARVLEDIAQAAAGSRSPCPGHWIRPVEGLIQSRRRDAAGCSCRSRRGRPGRRTPPGAGSKRPPGPGSGARRPVARVRIVLARRCGPPPRAGCGAAGQLPPAAARASARQRLAARFQGLQQAILDHQHDQDEGQAVGQDPGHVEELKEQVQLRSRSRRCAPAVPPPGPPSRSGPGPERAATAK